MIPVTTMTAMVIHVINKVSGIIFLLFYGFLFFSQRWHSGAIVGDTVIIVDFIAVYVRIKVCKDRCRYCTVTQYIRDPPWLRTLILIEIKERDFTIELTQVMEATDRRTTPFKPDIKLFRLTVGLF